MSVRVRMEPGAVVMSDEAGIQKFPFFASNAYVTINHD
jgi:hypothetical protein